MAEQTIIDELKDALRGYSKDWTPGPKVKQYVGQFFAGEVAGKKITAHVIGNHGTYRVTIIAKENRIDSACSCYIGKHGGCHHTSALALTFLKQPEIFHIVEPQARKGVRTLEDLARYVKSTSLEELLQQLKEKGIKQSEFAESIGMASQHLSAVKSSAARNRFFYELGATKLACLWVLENIKATPPKAVKKKAAKKKPVKKKAVPKKPAKKSGAKS